MKYETFLVKATDVLFEEAAEQGLTWEKFAEHAGVATSTVYRLGTRQTRFPLLRTFFKLAQCVGMEVEFKKQLRKFKVAS